MFDSSSGRGSHGVLSVTSCQNRSQAAIIQLYAAMSPVRGVTRYNTTATFRQSRWPAYFKPAHTDAVRSPPRRTQRRNAPCDPMQRALAPDLTSRNNTSLANQHLYEGGPSAVWHRGREEDVTVAQHVVSRAAGPQAICFNRLPIPSTSKLTTRCMSRVLLGGDIDRNSGVAKALPDLSIPWPMWLPR